MKRRTLLKSLLGVLAAPLACFAKPAGSGKVIPWSAVKSVNFTSVDELGSKPGKAIKIIWSQQTFRWHDSNGEHTITYRRDADGNMSAPHSYSKVER